jgi:hypothetical protein
VSPHLVQNVTVARRNRAPPREDGCTKKARTVGSGATRGRGTI